MRLSKFRSGFKKSSDLSTAPAAIDAAVQPEAAKDAVPAETPAEAVVEAKPAEAVAAPTPAPNPAPEAAPSRASKLVEGEKPRPADPYGSLRAKIAIARAVEAARPYRRQAKLAATLALTAGLGFAGGMLATGGSQPRQVLALAAPVEAPATRARDLEVERLAAEVKTLRTGLDASRSERSRGEGSAKHAQQIDKQGQQIEKSERAQGELAARIGRLSDAIEKLEKTQRDAPRLQAVIERLDRIEKTAQLAPPVAAVVPTPPPVPVAAIPVPPIKPDVTQTGSLPDARTARAEPAARAEVAKAEVAKVEGKAEVAKVEGGKPDGAKAEVADVRRTQLDGYVVRDVDDGYALIETKTGRFLEVAVGHVLAGVGRVEAVERRGRQWVVVTPRGFIGERWN